MGKWIKGFSEEDRRRLFFWKSILFGDFGNRVFFYIIVALWPFGYLLGWIDFTLGNIGLFILTSLGLPTLTGLISYFSTYEEPLKTIQNHYSIMMLLEKSVPHFQNVLQDTAKLGVIKSTFDKLPDEFGGIVIGAKENEYMERLENLIPSAKTFYATLRGGQQPRYTIGWFFEDSSLTHEQKIKYLKAVNEKSMDKKIRIVILEKKEMVDFCNDKWRKKFFEYSENVKTYLISPDALTKELLRKRVIQTHFIMEDYAIFDETMAIKHNGQNSLYLGARDQISFMCLPFTLALTDTDLRTFHKIDGTGIKYYDTTTRHSASKTWENWKNEFITSFPEEVCKTIIKIYCSSEENTVEGACYANFCDGDTFKRLVLANYTKRNPTSTKSFDEQILLDVCKNISPYLPDESIIMQRFSKDKLV